MAGDKQTRIGLVLNGGLSLAVWMGGVVHEIDLLRRASRQVMGLDHEVPVAEYDAPIYDVWTEFCRSYDVGRVIVDVVAGTSAGGLNGTLLATAIGRGGVLDPPRADGEGPRLREMWDHSADLTEGRLLRRPADQLLPSVLDGEFFQRTVVNELAKVGPPDDGDDRDVHEPVTLFMTATALGTSNTRYTDSFGHDFDVADHRRLYRFRKTERGACRFVPHDGRPDAGWFPSEQVDHFALSKVADPDAPPIDALSRVARATASFPIAFAPVEETDDVVAHRIVPPAEAATEPGMRWLVDGGVLDNSPFGPVLDAVTNRRVRGEVERLLVYVVPSEGVRVVDPTPRDAPDTGVARAGAPHDPWPSILTKAVSLPGEADLRGDIETTRQLVARAEGANAGPEALFADSLRTLTTLGGAAAADLSTRRCGTGDTPIEATATGLLEQYRLARTVGGLRDIRAELSAAHPGRSMVLRPGRDDEARTLMAKHRPVWVPPSNVDLAPDADDAGGWCWGLAAAERVARYMLRDLRARQRDEDDQGVRGALTRISLTQLRIDAVREAVSDHLRRLDGVDLVREGYDEDVALIDKVGESFRELRVPEALLWCVQEAADAYASAVRNVNPADVVCIGLAVEVSSQAFTAYQPSERTPPFKLLRLGPDVDTPACDPRPDASNGTTRDRKLYGARMGHFGAFGLPDWRRWDWMCGRLDAQVHLARALAAGSGDDSAVEDLIVKLQMATLERERTLSPEQFKAKRDALITRGDAEVLAELDTAQGGGDLVEAVVDAAVRALPHPLALPGVGPILNSLFAGKPKNRWRPWWVSPARLVTRRWLKGRLKRLTTPKAPR